ncbi:hypothetical protein Ddye_019914 [Dipteronia dyeriana]|uniref:Uncharacterized protein n=1 Tax=Dipteronia dyeriana TaxID=168575 RepID=A0AAD9TZQ6_9ROSI|nr:hypothetical protein Ddye_019914 [Dipteronia dyeriana]
MLEPSNACMPTAIFSLKLLEPGEKPESRPLVLWLNGGPDCPHVAYGAAEDIGPLRIRLDGKTLYPNRYSWNMLANMLFLESPAGVGFAYTNTTLDLYTTSDQRIVDCGSMEALVALMLPMEQLKILDLYAFDSMARLCTPIVTLGTCVSELANMLFLDSLAGVGFAYTNTTLDLYTTSDQRIVVSDRLRLDLRFDLGFALGFFSFHDLGMGMNNWWSEMTNENGCLVNFKAQMLLSDLRLPKFYLLDQIWSNILVYCGILTLPELFGIHEEDTNPYPELFDSIPIDNTNNPYNFYGMQAEDD